MAKSLSLRSQSKLDPTVSDVTVVIPVHRDVSGEKKEWLDLAKDSIPEGAKYTVAVNDGDMVSAVNKAVEEADTEFVFPMGADDALTVDCLEMLLALSDGMDVIYPTQVLTGEDLENAEGYNIASPFCPHRLETMNYISGAALVRRDAWLEVGGYRDLDILEDWDLWLRMARAGKRFQHVPEAKYVWRQVRNSRNKGMINFYEFREEILPDPTPVKAAFVYQASYATTYLRCLLPARYLPGQAWEWGSFPVVSSRDTQTLEFPDVPENVVLQFPGDMKRLITLWGMQDSGKKVFVEVDDSYLTKGPIRSTRWQDKASEDGHSYEAHRKIVEQSDGVIATTEHLAKQYLKAGAKKAWVCPNMVDPTDWPMPAWEEDDVFRVGWFASRSHFDDAKLIERALEWCGRQHGVEVYVMGVNPKKWQKKQRKRGRIQYTQLPWTNDMRTYYRMLQMLDVGVAPVVETPWSVCRSDVKPLELAMAGALPVLSEAIPYRGWTDGDACLKARDSKEFLTKLQWCVKNKDEVKALAGDAKDYVLKERDIRSAVSCWEEVFDG